MHTGGFRPREPSFFYNMSPMEKTDKAGMELPDVQSGKAAIPIRINRVGIRGLEMPILVRQRDHAEPQRTVASISLGVDLAAEENGTHMSRFVETLQGMIFTHAPLDYSVAFKILRDTRARLRADRAHISFSFPYFLQRKAPVSGIPALMSYGCVLAGEIDRENGDGLSFSPFLLDIKVPVMTVCPCSKAISDEGAHSQRADVRISTRMNGLVWIEDLVEVAEKAGSSPVYSLLKRADEKHVTEHAFAQPCFVEDVARRVADALSKKEHVVSFKVEVESYESIHAHNAFAYIES